MQKLENEQILYSPSDLIKFLECHHASFLDEKALVEELETTEDSKFTQLLQQKGFEHEEKYLELLRSEGKKVTVIPKDEKLEVRAELTIEALKSGTDVIFQGVFFNMPWRGDADFLIKCDTPSNLGNFSYEVLDTKLSRRVSPKYIMQLCVYSELLTNLQGQSPELMHLLLGDGEKHSFKILDFYHYYMRTKNRFENFIQNLPKVSYPEPCSYCNYCKWSGMCNEKWKTDNHLSLVANIQRSQIKKLREAGINSVKDLASTTQSTQIPDLNPAVFKRLRSQAILQHHRETTGENKFELLPLETGKGLNRMPAPDPSDLFFDMEGDPLYPDGLEYLFGVYYLKNGEEVFKPFWAHNHTEEKEAFRNFMEFLDQHLSNHPNAHIYHYNHYETTALKRLACRYAVCEEQMDNLLREQKFIDLYVVVRESIRTSESGYSIKNLETFYMNEREEDVATADESIVVYNEWTEVGDDELLQKIADYNKKDCISTLQLQKWLLKNKPENVKYFEISRENTSETNVERKDWEIQYENYQKRLCVKGANTPKVNLLLSHLLEFHKREEKSQWWSIFERQLKDESELIDDTECIGGMQQIGVPTPEKKSLIHTFKFQPQDYKLKIGSQVCDVKNLESAGTIVEIDDNIQIVKIKRGATKGHLPEFLSIGPSGPVNTKVIRGSIYLYADDLLNSPETARTTTEILKRKIPNIRGIQTGDHIINTSDQMKGTLEAISNLENSYLFIQGPPGAGKTYTCSHIIMDLINKGKKIGVTSNSHKAIHNLLVKVEKVAREKGIRFTGFKKASSSNVESEFHGDFISSVKKLEDMRLNANLFAGTAWAFSDPYFSGQLDYLFFDEAGQISTANVVAMSSATKNIILVGDQMQLSQPIQGIHPGEAGQSILEFLLQGQSTIPPNQGVFLQETRRMHPRICEFISNAFYDSRLVANEVTTTRSLNLKNKTLPNEGIVVIPLEHEGCSQKSEEEGEIIKTKYHELLGRDIIEHGKKRPITKDDILVVAPYNVQVNYLQSLLPENAKVGTIDKFQGQEAPVVLISMTTSSAETLPRNIEFLYSKNRLNVAISRAQCLAVVILNPKLLEIPCNNVEQMKLVNTFCWLNEYASQ